MKKSKKYGEHLNDLLSPYAVFRDAVIYLLGVESIKKDEVINKLIRSIHAALNQGEAAESASEQRNMYQIAGLLRESFFLLGDLSKENIEQIKEKLDPLGKKLMEKTFYGGQSVYDAYIESIKWLINGGDAYGDDDFYATSNTAFKKSMAVIKRNPELVKKIVDNYNRIYEQNEMPRKEKIASQVHRRLENNNTLAHRLRQWFCIEVNFEDPEERRQYEQLCQEFEKIEYKPLDKEDRTKDNKRKNWNIRFGDLFREDRMPLDLLIPVREEDDRYGKKYRPYMQRLKSRLLEMTEEEGNYNIYFCQFLFIHKKICTKIEDMVTIISPQVEEDVENYKDIVKQRIKERELSDFSSSEDDLLSKVLLAFLKIDIINQIRTRQYIYDHSNVFSKRLSLDENACQAFEKIYRETYYDDWIYPNSLESAKNIFLETYRKEVELILNRKDIETVYNRVFKIAKYYAKKLSPSHEDFGVSKRMGIPKINFLSLMICCNNPENYQLEIRHFGIPRGKISISLKRLIKEIDMYYCIEVWSFWQFLIKRTVIVYLYGEKKAKLWTELSLFFENQLKEDIGNAKSWSDLDRRGRQLQIYSVKMKELEEQRRNSPT